MYKIISKILVSCLRPLLDKLVSPFQSAFIPGRSIHDNILITHKVMHKFKVTKGKTAWAVIKLDMEKAYNKLEWDFLFAYLMQMGFHSKPISKWIGWIKECVTTVSYSLLVNNSSHGFFRPSRGIRQGDPLSPYLFILCMNFFILRLCDLTQNPKSGVGIRLSLGSLTIPYLFFADDSLLFCKTNLESCRKLKHIIDEFCRLSGQFVNF